MNIELRNSKECMRVLLLGEYSGFYKNLKRGLQELGVDVTLIANGDSFKEVGGADNTLFIDGDSNPFRRIYNKVVVPATNKKELYGYDVVQLVTENIYTPYVNRHMIKAIKKHNGKLFVSLSGNHQTVYESWKTGKLRYYTYDNNEEKYELFVKNSLRNILYRNSAKFVDKIADGIIPTTYEYAVGIRSMENAKPTIPLPFDAREVAYIENKVDEKIHFYHGLLRPKDKGGDVIKQALNIIKEKYPNDVEICVADTLPLKEYLRVIEKTNVLVDFCKEHCWGMNACYAMAMGKVVMSGATQESLQEFGLNESPIIHIEPDVDFIVRQMEYILDNKERITEWGRESRKFVEEFHDAKRIASLYMDVWKE